MTWKRFKYIKQISSHYTKLWINEYLKSNSLPLLFSFSALNCWKFLGFAKSSQLPHHNHVRHLYKDHTNKKIIKPDEINLTPY